MMSNLAFSIALLLGSFAIVLMSVSMSFVSGKSRRQDQATTLTGAVIAILIVDWLVAGEWRTGEFGKNMLHLSAILVFEYQCFCNIMRRYRSMSTVTKPPIRPKPSPIPGQK